MCSETDSDHLCNCGEPKANHNGCCNCYCGTCYEICAASEGGRERQLPTSVQNEKIDSYDDGLHINSVEAPAPIDEADQGEAPAPLSTENIYRTLNLDDNSGGFVKRYKPYMGESTSNDCDDCMNAYRFRQHLITGDPFIVNIPPEMGGYTTDSFPKSLDEWSKDFSLKWSNLDPNPRSIVLWQGRLSDEDR